MQNAEQRELLTRMLDRDKERYRQEDREIEIKMAEQGIRWVGFSSVMFCLARDDESGGEQVFNVTHSRLN